jgi:molybdenum cofactor biosynthesis enzyme
LFHDITNYKSTVEVFEQVPVQLEQFQACPLLYAVNPEFEQLVAVQVNLPCLWDMVKISPLRFRLTAETAELVEL